jgi:hypothetical protein
VPFSRQRTCLLRNHGTAPRGMLVRAVAIDPMRPWAWSRLAVDNYSDRRNVPAAFSSDALQFEPLTDELLNYVVWFGARSTGAMTTPCDVPPACRATARLLDPAQRESCCWSRTHDEAAA